VLLWTYPGIVTGTPYRAFFTAELDLGLRWRHPTTVRIAGINPRRESAAESLLAGLLPEGTRFVALAEHIDDQSVLRAHIVLADGTDVASLIRHARPELPTATYGGAWDKTWRYPATVVKVCDADTFRARVDLGVRTVQEVNIRVGHVNAPESDTAEGQAATVWAEGVLQPGAAVDLHSRSLDKYGRPLADVTLPDCSDYARRLLDASHAIPYEGGPR
jgi:endonuclease YncB( thermonuclease family)